MFEIIETHCHLDYLKEKPLEEILQAAKDNGITKIITIAVEPDNFDAAFNLSQEHDMIYSSQGIHPHDAKLCTEQALKTIEERQSNNKVVAVGEIGLDYHYDNSPRDIQKVVFKQQLEIAIRTDKPVVIHSRDADEDMISILSEYAPKMNKKGVIHSFTAGEELALRAIELGFYLGFNGIITFKKAENVRDIVKLCPLDRILLETDSPFLTPVPHRGKENSPEYLPHILEKISEIKEISKQELAAQCLINSKNLFVI
jgi:TatD DNase family protein